MPDRVERIGAFDRLVIARGDAKRDIKKAGFISLQALDTIAKSHEVDTSDLIEMLTTVNDYAVDYSKSTIQ